MAADSRQRYHQPARLLTHKHMVTVRLDLTAGVLGFAFSKRETVGDDDTAKQR